MFTSNLTVPRQKQDNDFIFKEIVKAFTGYRNRMTKCVNRNSSMEIFATLSTKMLSEVCKAVLHYPTQRYNYAKTPGKSTLRNISDKMSL